MEVAGVITRSFEIGHDQEANEVIHESLSSILVECRNKGYPAKSFQVIPTKYRECFSGNTLSEFNVIVTY